MGIMRTWVAASSCLLFACGGDDQGFVAPDAEVTGVEGHARIVKGPSGGSAATRIVPGGGPAADGRWAISPDQATLTFTAIHLTRDDGQPYSWTFVEECRPTYVAGDAALTELLDCPFEIAPGTYVSIGITASTTYEVVIDDAVNGIYTDPSATTKVTVGGAGPGQPVSFTVPGPGGEGDQLTYAAFFAEPLIVEEGAATISVQILVDMIHMIGMTIDGGVATVDTSAPALPAELVPSASGAAKAEFYSAIDSAANTMIGPVGQTSTWQGARVFHAASDQPSYVFHPVPDPSQAYSVDPAQAPWNTQEFKPGGYLGIDATDTMCWAMADNDYSWATYARLCRMALTTSGGSTTIECDVTTDVPPPTSGATYASGCPPLGQVDETMTVYLIAD